MFLALSVGVQAHDTPHVPVADPDSSCDLDQDGRSCWTGNHLRAGRISHGFRDASGSGTVVSTLSHSGGERTWTCTYVNGASAGCEGSGTWPADGSDYAHTCDVDDSSLSVNCYTRHGVWV